MRQETEVIFLIGTVILGFLSVFKKSLALSPYEALTSVCFSTGKRDLRPPVQMRRTPTAFSRFSTGDSDMPSSCEMKDETEFKPLEEKQVFFCVRASRSPFHLRQKAQGPSHIPTAEGKLLLRCLWKFGSPLQSKTENQLSSWDDIGCMELSLSCCTEINIHIDLRLLSQGISVVCYRKSSHLFCMMWNMG